MNKSGTINSFQMFSVLFLSRSIALFTFLLPSSANVNSGDRILSPFLLIIIECIINSFIIFIIKKNSTNGLIKNINCKNSYFGKAVSILYVICFIWYAGLSVSRFELFISTVMFPNSEVYAMIILLLIISFFASLKGFESIARASVIFLVFLLLSLIFIFTTVSADFHYANLSPAFTDGFSPIIKLSLYISLRSCELITLYINAPKISGNIKKMSYGWIIIFGILTSLTLLIISAVTGEYGENQLFQFYSLTVIAKIGIFERLDDILSGLWVLCSFIQVSFLLTTCLNALEQGFNKIKKIPLSFFCTLAVFIVYILTSDTITIYSSVIDSNLQVIIFIAFCFVIPLVATLYSVKTRRKKL